MFDINNRYRRTSANNLLSLSFDLTQYTKLGRTRLGLIEGRSENTPLMTRSTQDYSQSIKNLLQPENSHILCQILKHFSFRAIKDVKMVCKRLQEVINFISIKGETLLQQKCLVKLGNVKQLVFIACITPLHGEDSGAIYNLFGNKDALYQILKYHPRADLRMICKKFYEVIFENKIQYQQTLSNVQLLSFDEYAQARFAADFNINLGLKLKNNEDIDNLIIFIEERRDCLKNIEIIAFGKLGSNNINHAQKLLYKIFDNQNLFLSFKTLIFNDIGLHVHAGNTLSLDIPGFSGLEKLKFKGIGIDLNLGHFPALKSFGYGFAMQSNVDENLMRLCGSLQFKGLSKIKISTGDGFLRFSSFMECNENVCNLANIHTITINTRFANREKEFIQGILDIVYSKQRFLTGLTKIIFFEPTIMEVTLDYFLKGINFPKFSDKIKMEVHEEMEVYEAPENSNEIINEVD